MEHAISVKQLSKSYGSVSAVKNVSISIRRGEIFGLLGANGAGKSTLMECALGTKKPDSGSVSILGQDPNQDRRRLFERVGVQFQESSYQEKITVKELCAVTRSLYCAPLDPDCLLARFDLCEKQNALVSELSGGQKQRLFIVLALLPNPEVLFLDELTTGLDAKARRSVWQYLKDLKSAGRTVFLTSHFMDEIAALCDNIGILKRGDLVFYDSPQEAVASGPFQTLEDAYLWFAEEESNHENI